MIELSYQPATSQHLKSVSTHLAVWFIFYRVVSAILAPITLLVIYGSINGSTSYATVFFVSCTLIVIFIFLTGSAAGIAYRSRRLRAQLVDDPWNTLHAALALNTFCLILICFPPALAVIMLLINILTKGGSVYLRPSSLFFLVIFALPFAVLLFGHLATRRTLHRALAANPHLAPPTP